MPPCPRGIDGVRPFVLDLVPDVFEFDPAAGSQARTCSFYAGEEAWIVLKTVVERIVLALEPDKDACWFPVT